jgi:hypothetical protein
MQFAASRRRNESSRVIAWIILALVTQATAAFGLNFNVPLDSLTNHNTSAYPAYNETNFPANFGSSCYGYEAVCGRGECAQSLHHPDAEVLLGI